jgi:hypothetical protein
VSLIGPAHAEQLDRGAERAGQLRHSCQDRLTEMRTIERY